MRQLNSAHHHIKIKGSHMVTWDVINIVWQINEHQKHQTDDKQMKSRHIPKFQSNSDAYVWCMCGIPMQCSVSASKLAHDAIEWFSLYT